MHRSVAGSVGQAKLIDIAKYGSKYGMPSLIKSTYSLDSTSIDRIRHLAKRWQISKTAVLRRALQIASQREMAASPEAKIAALHRLQKKLRETGVDFARWKRDTKRGRR
jgi:hypothetical protein